VNAPGTVLEGLFQTDPPALIGARCRNCGALRFPAIEVCANCQREESDRVELSDHGTVFTFTIVHAAPPGYCGEVPYALGVVELPEGLRVTSTLLADDLGRVEIDAPCRLELFELAAEPPVETFGFRIEGS
jgi:uncharacterized OB-fold protein